MDLGCLSLLPPSRQTKCEVSFVHLATRPGATRGGDCLRCDASAHQPRIGPGSSAPRRRTSLPGVCFHPAPTPVRSEIKHIRASGATSTWRLGPGATRGDTSAQWSGVTPGSFTSRRWTSRPGVCLHPAPISVRSEIGHRGWLGTDTTAMVIGPTTISSTKLSRSRHIYQFLSFNVL